MLIRNRIFSAIEALLSFQNEDGGIPATSPEKTSGSWTSADTLEAIIVSGAITTHGIGRVKRLVYYLIESQIGSTEIQSQGSKLRQSNKLGSWALYQGLDPSTMATGHSTAALILSRKVFNDDDVLLSKINRAVSYGLQWIEKNQNSDGGWGTQPLSGASGKTSSIIAIEYALLPYYYKQENMNSSASVRKAVEYLLHNQKHDGSWAAIIGKDSDACNTARALTSLIRCGYKNEACKNRAITYILTKQNAKNNLWDIEAERYDIEKAPAQIVYNDNTNCDIMIAFMEAEYIGKSAIELMKWLINSQGDNGLWHLSSPNKTVKEISTWSTAEWVIAVDKGSQTLFNNVSSLFGNKVQRKIATYQRILIFMTVINIVLLKINTIIVYWNNQTSETRTLISVGVFLALAVNILAAVFFEFLKKWYFTTKNYINSVFKNHK